MAELEIRHARRNGHPGLTACGLNMYMTNGVKFGKNRSQFTCPECIAAIERLMAKNPGKVGYERAARLRTIREAVLGRKKSE